MQTGTFLCFVMWEVLKVLFLHYYSIKVQKSSIKTTPHTALTIVTVSRTVFFLLLQISCVHCIVEEQHSTKENVLTQLVNGFFQRWSPKLV